MRESVEYDPNDKRISRTDGEGRLVTETLDGRERLIVTEYPNSPLVTKTTFEYDLNNQQVAKVTPNGHRWAYDYDNRQRLAAVDSPEGAHTQFTYDANGNHTQTIDALGKVTVYDYDARNQRTTIGYPDAAQHAFSYDAAGNLDIVTQPNGNQVQYQHDALNRLASVRYLPGGGLQGSTEIKVDYQYDANNNLASVTEALQNRTQTTALSYDSFDRLESRIDPVGLTHRFRYDLNGNRQEYNLDGDITAYRYDRLNRLTSVEHQGVSSAYTYYRDSRLKTRKPGNGTASDYTYNERGDITQISHKVASAEFASVAYVYDANRNRIAQTEVNGRGPETTAYQYDKDDRLTFVSYPNVPTGEGNDVTLVYDAVGNRTGETVVNRGANATLSEKIYRYNDRHQLTEVTDALDASQNASWQYDAAGNQTQHSQNGNVTDYQYDLRQHMVGVVRNGQTLHSAEYDYQGLRIRSDSVSTGARLTSYDGLSAVLVADTTGTVLNRYHYGAGQLERLFDPSRGQQVYHNDALGSPIALTDASRNIAARYAYDAFGQYRRNENIDTDNVFGFTGHE